MAVRRSAAPITTSAMSRPTSADRPVPPPHLCRIWALPCPPRSRGLRRTRESPSRAARRSRSAQPTSVPWRGGASLVRLRSVLRRRPIAPASRALPCRTAVRTDDVCAHRARRGLLAASIPLIARSSAAAFFAPVGDPGEMLLSAVCDAARAVLRPATSCWSGVRAGRLQRPERR